MNDHVLDRIADYLAKRLSQEQHMTVETHLQDCGDCAGEFAWARQFKDAALRAGLRHLDPARIVELSDKREAISEPEAMHLRTCSHCENELQWAGDLQEPALDLTDALEHSGIAPGAREAVRGTPKASATGPGYRTWMGLAATLALAVSLVIFLPQGPDEDVAVLARIEPLPVRISRSVPEPDSYQEARNLGLEAYATGDYATASIHFAQALDRLPDEVEIFIYMGSSWLLQGQPDKAADVLRRAADLAAGTSLEPEALWQLANAELADGRSEPAAEALHRLQILSGPRADDANSLLADMESGR